MEEKITVVLNPQLKHRMDVDLGRYSERDAFFGVSELISLTRDAATVIFSHGLTGLTRAAYIGAGIKPSLCVLDVVRD